MIIEAYPVLVDTTIPTPVVYPDIMVPSNGVAHPAAYYVSLWTDVVTLKHPGRYEFQVAQGNTVGHRNIRIVEIAIAGVNIVPGVIGAVSTRAVIPYGSSRLDGERAKILYELFRVCGDDFTAYEAAMVKYRNRPPHRYAEI